jgi:hypothetical protein
LELNKRFIEDGVDVVEGSNDVEDVEVVDKDNIDIDVDIDVDIDGDIAVDIDGDINGANITVDSVFSFFRKNSIPAFQQVRSRSESYRLGSSEKHAGIPSVSCGCTH